MKEQPLIPGALLPTTHPRTRLPSRGVRDHRRLARPGRARVLGLLLPPAAPSPAFKQLDPVDSIRHSAYNSFN